VNKELERMCKEGALSNFKALSLNCLWGLRKTSESDKPPDLVLNLCRSQSRSASYFIEVFG
jgi:hypothetical protein